MSPSMFTLPTTCKASVGSNVLIPTIPPLPLKIAAYEFGDPSSWDWAYKAIESGFAAFVLPARV